MATIPFVAQAIETLYGHTISVYWPDMAAGDVGQAFGAPGASDRSAQVSGTWGTDGRVIIEGSNEITSNPTYVTLHDPFAVPLIFSGNGLSAITEISGTVRPRVTGTDPLSLLTVSLIVRRLL